MDLKALGKYCCASERTIREWIHRAENPLPAVQVQRGKILVKRSQFDAWLEKHALQSAARIDIGGIVDQVLGNHSWA